MILTRWNLMIADNGGERSGRDRRRSVKVRQTPERRSSKDRRKGFDRRGILGCRKNTDHRLIPNGLRDGAIERRDIFRAQSNMRPGDFLK